MSKDIIRFALNKLVRDHIPLITNDPQIRYHKHPLDDAAFIKALKQKLIEETQEVRDAQNDDLISELADVKEVIDELIKITGISQAQLNAVQEKKRDQRGGFNKRLFITYIDAPINSETYEYLSKDPIKYPIIEIDKV